MKFIAGVMLLCGLLAGCTTSSYDSGHDQLFQLSDRHVIYRDLTVPASMGNLPEKQEITSPGIEP